MGDIPGKAVEQGTGQEVEQEIGQEVEQGVMLAQVLQEILFVTW